MVRTKQMAPKAIKIKGNTYVLASESFLPEYLIMIDAEMTGVVPERDHLLQVAMLKLKLVDGQYAEVGEPFVGYLNYVGEPESDFHKKYLSHIFKKCNESTIAPVDLKPKIALWLGDLLGKVTPAGDCVPTDMAFLYANDCIDRPDISDEGPILGTFHYEYFDMNALKQVARHKVGFKEELALDVDHIHDALVDCQNQLKELNHYLKILLG